MKRYKDFFSDKLFAKQRPCTFICIFLLLWLSMTGQAQRHVTIEYINPTANGGSNNTATSDAPLTDISVSAAIPVYATNVTARAWGGGGGGGSGGAAYYQGGNGGGGAYVIKNFGNGGFTAAITVGHGGRRGESPAIGTITSGSPGTASHVSYNGVTITAHNGIGGGTGTNPSNGSGGSLAGGNGDSGISGYPSSQAGNGGTNSKGGDSPNGGNGGALGGNKGYNGNNPGGGGGGGNGISREPGGAGGGGRVFISFDLNPGTLTIISGTNIYCEGNTIVLSAVCNPCDNNASYVWYRNGTQVGTGSTLTIPYATPAHSGNYTVEATVSYTYSGVNGIQTASSSISSTPIPSEFSVSGNTLNGKITSAGFAVTVNPFPTAPTGASSQFFCTAPTLSELMQHVTPPNGSSLKWYQHNGTEIFGNPTLTNGSTYYAKSEVNGCIGCTSLGSLGVTVLVMNCDTTIYEDDLITATFLEDLLITSNGITPVYIRFYTDAQYLTQVNLPITAQLPSHTFYVEAELTTSENVTVVFRRPLTIKVKSRPIVAIKDYRQIPACLDSIVIDVLARDTMIHCNRNSIDLVLVEDTKTNATVEVDGDNNIVYKPDDSFLGYDTLIYKTICHDTIFLLKVCMLVVECPDNIMDDVECYGTPPKIVFSIKELARSDYGSGNGVSVVTNPVAGDIDGDGETEILVMNHKGQSDYFNTSHIHIYGFNKETNALYLKYTIDIPDYNEYQYSPIAIAKVDGDPYASIFYVSFADRKLYKYNFDGNIPNVFPSSSSWTQQWSSPPVYTNNTQYKFVAPVIADIMGAGRTQVVILNKVIDTQSGKIIAEGTGMIPSSGLSSTYSFGWFGHCGYGTFNNQGLMYESSPVVIDIDNDGIQELIGGDCVYSINLVNFDNPVPGNTFTLKKRASKAGHAEVGDGGTAVADIDNDGQLDVIVAGPNASNFNSTYGVLYVYNPRTGDVIHSNTITNIPRTDQNKHLGPSRPFVGDFDNDGFTEIALTGIKTLRSYKYNTGTGHLDLSWALPTDDESGSTTLTVFDFAHDGKNRLVYRDQTQLLIIDGSSNPPYVETYRNNVESPTINEFPIIVDVNDDGAAEIVVTGTNVGHQSNHWYFRGELRVYASNGEPWAPARKVWNQAAYNSVNVNDDLTIPRYPLNPATVFPGENGTWGTSEGTRPFNAFLKQQTILNKNGEPIWPMAEVTPVSVSSAVNGNAVEITVEILNQGDFPIGPWVYVSVYRDDTIPANFIVTDSADIQILPGYTGTVVVHINDITQNNNMNMANAVIRVNDRKGTFAYAMECDTSNNVTSIVNPVLDRLVWKKATLLSPPSPPFHYDGTFANPVSVLYADTIEYRIKAVNVNPNNNTTVIIRDTLSPYLKFESSVPSIIPTDLTNPDRKILLWTLQNLASMQDTIISVKATPIEGVNASQPMFINRAWVTMNGMTIPTNFTYHQGAGVSIMTFSHGVGGSIHNARIQALDYKTSPKSGVIVVPDEGYVFAGWSHDDYRSLKNELIRARSGIMLYDTLIIYGNVELKANFAPEEYDIIYCLNGGENRNNPLAYNIESQTITLADPEKTNDVFIGWTGSNGDEPQKAIIIPKGSTGKRTYYANYLHSGREDHTEIEISNDNSDRIWVIGNELNVYTSKAGSIVRVFTPDGVLHRLQPIISTGETKIKLSQGVYIVVLNNNVGQKIAIFEN